MSWLVAGAIILAAIIIADEMSACVDTYIKHQNRMDNSDDND